MAWTFCMIILRGALWLGVAPGPKVFLIRPGWGPAEARLRPGRVLPFLRSIMCSLRWTQTWRVCGTFIYPKETWTFLWRTGQWAAMHVKHIFGSKCFWSDVQYAIRAFLPPVFLLMPTFHIPFSNDLLLGEVKVIFFHCLPRPHSLSLCSLFSHTNTLKHTHTHTHTHTQPYLWSGFQSRPAFAVSPQRCFGSQWSGRRRCPCRAGRNPPRRNRPWDTEKKQKAERPSWTSAVNHMYTRGQSFLLYYTNHYSFPPNLFVELTVACVCVCVCVCF